MQVENPRPVDSLYMKIAIEDPKIELHSDDKQVELQKVSNKKWGIKLSNHKGIKGEAS